MRDFARYWESFKNGPGQNYSQNDLVHMEMVFYAGAFAALCLLGKGAEPLAILGEINGYQSAMACAGKTPDPTKH